MFKNVVSVAQVGGAPGGGKGKDEGAGRQAGDYGQAGGQGAASHETGTTVLVVNHREAGGQGTFSLGNGTVEDHDVG
jgi:hypothetical protein